MRKSKKLGRIFKRAPKKYRYPFGISVWVIRKRLSRFVSVELNSSHFHFIWSFKELQISGIVHPKRWLTMGLSFISRSLTKRFRWDMSSPKHPVTTGQLRKP